MRTKPYSSNQNTLDVKKSDKAERQMKAMSALSEMRQNALLRGAVDNEEIEMLVKEIRKEMKI